MLQVDKIVENSLEEVLPCINGLKIIPEDPQTGVENCIIVWGMEEE